MSRNRSETSCECGFALDESRRSRAELMTETQYFAVLGMPTSHPYFNNGGYGWGGERGRETLFRKIECPLCGATYAGWYTARWCVPSDGDRNWSLFDSCYFLAFNDEPCDEDRPKVTDVRAAIARWRALERVAPAVALFFAGGEWTESRKHEWKERTGFDEATSHTLCDAIRMTLGDGGTSK